MMGHNICLKEYYGKLSLNYPIYPFLSGALKKNFKSCDMSDENFVSLIIIYGVTLDK